MTTLAAWSARLPAVNADGTFTAEFIRWLQRQLIERVGGVDAMSNLELAQAIADAAQAPATQPVSTPRFADDLLAPVFVLPPAVEDANGRLQAAEARIDQLARAIHDLQQGTQL